MCNRRWIRQMLLGLIIGWGMTGCVDLQAGEEKLRRMGYYDVQPSHPYTLTSCSSSCKKAKCHATCVTF